ncbi:MAG TPA: penicillin-binding protein activator, partial [Steroidobacteraceae bacterium]|nr:penicillin-binding protein activator [Steroidobacteraceae bacterium]
MPRTVPATQPAALRLVALLAAALLSMLAGCATQGGAPESEERAARLLRNGDNAGAAEMYEHLAQHNAPPGRNDFALAAARAWLAANRPDDARRALDLAGTAATPAQRLESGMLRAQLSAALGQYRAAWQQISQLQQPQDHAAASRLLQLRQQIALQAGEPVEAVRAGMARERLAATDEERTAARRDLLAQLRGAIEDGLKVNPATSNDALVRGWLEIAQIAAAAARNPLNADADVARWRQRV